MSVRKSPCEYYIKYLVSHPSNYSNAFIQEDLATHGLDWLGLPYLDRVKRQTIRPVPFRPLDRGHLASQQFLAKHRIFSMYFKDAATTGALYILEHPKVKEFTEAMLLTGAPPALVARGAPHALNCLPLTEAGVQRFQHYFWNTDLLDFTETRAVIAKRGADSEDKDYKKAFWRDSRKIACDLPFSPLSAALAQIRLGITPRNINFAELMERVRIVAGIKTFQWVLEDHPEAAESARNYITVAKEATELMERSSKPEEKLLERFNALGIENDLMPVPHIKQLSGGAHTTDLQITDAKREVVEVDDDTRASIDGRG